MHNLTLGKARRSHRRRLVASAALISLLLGGCQAAREQILETAIEKEARWLHTGSFAHLIITRTKNPASDILHVYIEGDGKPWIKNRYIAKDPSPENPLALHLMLQDPQNTLYLGRPCYFTNFRGKDASCHPAVWTSARYSESVVESMVAALEAVIEMTPYSKVALIGYSGGGTLAYLMAGRTDKIDRLVTIAANLDHSAWTNYHDYSPLHDSLEPGATNIPRTVGQLHLRGARDRNVPEKVLQKFILDDKASWVTFPGYDHVCCWEKNWRDILDTFIVDTGTSNRGGAGPAK